MHISVFVKRIKISTNFENQPRLTRIAKGPGGMVLPSFAKYCWKTNYEGFFLASYILSFSSQEINMFYTLS